jgi:hypothetical protein
MEHGVCGREVMDEGKKAGNSKAGGLCKSHEIIEVFLIFVMRQFFFFECQGFIFTCLSKQ